MGSKEKKVPTCRVCGADMPPKTKICPNCGTKNAKPVYKRPWFIVLVVIFVIAIIANLGDSTVSPETNTASVGSATTNAAAVADKNTSANKPAVTTQDAIAMDQRVYGIILVSAGTTDQLSTQIQSQGALLDTYNTAKADKDAQFSLWSKIQDIVDDKDNKKFGDALSDYASSAQNYILSAQSYAGNIIKYIDKSEMKYLSNAQSDMQQIQNGTLLVQAARLTFLSSFGLTSEQVGDIMSGK